MKVSIHFVIWLNPGSWTLCILLHLLQMFVHFADNGQ